MGFVSYRDEQREGRPEQRLLGKDQLCLLGRQLGGSRLGVRALRIQGTLEHRMVCRRFAVMDRSGCLGVLGSTSCVAGGLGGITGVLGGITGVHVVSGVVVLAR